MTRAARDDVAGRMRSLVRLLSVVVTGLLVWIVFLGVSLPTSESTRQWKLLWIGFDMAEFVGLAITLWAVYRSRPLAIPAALITGTLFACDAWFDVVLSWDSRGWWFSLATAALVELPLAAVLWRSAGVMVRAVITRQAGQAAMAPVQASAEAVQAATEAVRNAAESAIEFVPRSSPEASWRSPRACTASARTSSTAT